MNNDVSDVEYELSEDVYYGRTDNEVYDYTKNSAMTISEAFSLIESYQSKAHRIETEYDPRFGYPTRIFIDIDSLMADEEIIRRFSKLERILNK